MDQDQLIVLGSLLKALGVTRPPDGPDGMDQRIALQKQIYLLAMCGQDLGYRYKWDRFGPYSEALSVHARRYFEIEAELERMINSLRLKQEITEKVNSVRQLVNRPNSIEAEVTQLEILASLHYLATTKYKSAVASDKNGDLPEKLRDDLLKMKPRLRGHEKSIGAAWQQLKPWIHQRVS